MYSQGRQIITTAPIRAVQVIPVQAVLLPIPVHQAILPLEAARMRRQEGSKKFVKIYNLLMGVITSRQVLCVIAATIHQQKQTV